MIITVTRNKQKLDTVIIRTTFTYVLKSSDVSKMLEETKQKIQDLKNEVNNSFLTEIENQTQVPETKATKHGYDIAEYIAKQNKWKHDFNSSAEEMVLQLEKNAVSINSVEMFTKQAAKLLSDLQIIVNNKPDITSYIVPKFNLPPGLLDVVTKLGTGYVPAFFIKLWSFARSSKQQAFLHYIGSPPSKNRQSSVMEKIVSSNKNLVCIILP